MPEQSKNKVPAIRFYGFDGDWEVRSFGDIALPISSNTLSRADLNYKSGSAKNVHYGDILVRFGEVLDAGNPELPFVTSHEIVQKFRASRLQDGDIVIADAAEDETVGKCIELSSTGNAIVLAGLHTIAVRPSIKFAPFYLGYFLNSHTYHNQLLPLMQGTKVLSVSRTTLGDTRVMFPPDEDEQAQIGAYFKSLDRMIGLHQRKHDKLVTLKQAMLQKMFPQDGATTPEIRFKGFEADWVETVFKDFAPRTTEGSSAKPLPRLEYEDIVSGAGRLNKDLSKKVSDKSGIKFQSGDVLFGKLRPYLKNWLFADFEGVAVGDFWVLRSEVAAPSFIYLLIQTDRFDNVANQSSGSKMPRADWPLVSNTLFLIPSDINEQEKIGTYFSSIDALISKHATQVEKLKNIKSACLEKMFV